MEYGFWKKNQIENNTILATAQFGLNNLQPGAASTNGIEPIISNKDLSKMWPNPAGFCVNNRDKEIDALEQIIEKLHNKHIQVIIFVAPYSKSYLDGVPDFVKNDFVSTLQNFTKQNNVKLYNFMDKYMDMEI